MYLFYLFTLALFFSSSALTRRDLAISAVT